MPVPDDVARTVLPIPDRPYAGSTYFDARAQDPSFPPIQPLRPPRGAPNVLIVLLDDVGFGASSAFGGPVHTPVAERLAGTGVSYTRFHTTALCSPTRAALLTGRNHHSVGFGVISEFATSAPGYTSMRPNSCATVAEVLKLNGYATAHVGKCHEVPTWENSPAGPYDRWPSPGNGFEYFYGFLGGETDQWYPSLVEGTTRAKPWGTPEEGYHLTEDLTDKAIHWVNRQQALVPDKPFFLYYAPGAAHAPHQVAQEWIEKYADRFDEGWDVLREQTFARQKEVGVIPSDAALTRRHDEIPAWDDMPVELKPVLARQMETYAGFLEHADHQVGRLVDAIDELGLLENTLVYYIIGDNGASAEGTVQGTFNEMISLNGRAELETPEFLRSRVDQWGSPESAPHFAVGWAHATNTPYQWTKQVASHWGGTRNATIISWPSGFDARGELRHQFHHVIDVVPTLLEAAGIPEPSMVNGIRQDPIQGVSMLYTLNDADAADRHETQYFEMFGNRGIYHDGWSAVTKHRTPWQTTGDVGIALDDDLWELYDGSADWTQAHDLSKEHPEKLHELQRLFLIEAARHNVLPLDDRGFERILPAVSGRPTLIKADRQLLLPGMGGLTTQHMVNFRNRSWSMTSQVDVPEGGAQGVLLTFGSHHGGLAVYLKAGVPTFCYNYFGIEYTYIRGADPLPAGEHQLQMTFAYDGGGIGKGGNVRLTVDGREAAEGRVEQTHPISFLAEYTDVGRDELSTVTDEYARGDNAFTGTIKWIELRAGDDSHDHLIDPKDFIRVAMARE